MRGRIVGVLLVGLVVLLAAAPASALPQEDPSRASIEKAVDEFVTALSNLWVLLAPSEWGGGGDPNGLVEPTKPVDQKDAESDAVEPTQWGGGGDPNG